MKSTTETLVFATSKSDFIFNFYLLLYFFSFFKLNLRRRLKKKGKKKTVVYIVFFSESSISIPALEKYTRRKIPIQRKNLPIFSFY